MIRKLAFLFSLFLLLGYANATSASEWSLFWSVGDTTPTFYDMNIFEWMASGVYTQETDLNILSDYNIVFDFNVSGIDLNFDSMEIYYTIQHGTDDVNCFMNIRNTELCGWKNEVLDFTLIDGNATAWNFLSESEDDHAFKHSAQNLDPDDMEVKGTSFDLKNQNTWVKTLITNAKHSDALTDSNVFFNYSFSANYIGIGNRNLNVYDCNSSVVNPTTSTFCNSFTFSSSSTKEKDNYFSIFNISNDQNEIVSDYNVKLNSDGQHFIYYNCDQCNVNQYWSMGMIDDNSNIDRERNWTTTTGLGGLSVTEQTSDSHIHWQNLSLTHVFAWIAQLANNAGTDYNSQVNFEVVDSVNVPPTVLDINEPVQETTVSGIVSVIALVTDPNDDVLTCDFHIFNSQSDLVKSSINNAVTNGVCSFDYDTTSYYDDTHFASVVVRETLTTELFYGDFNQSIGYSVDNNNPRPIPIVKPPQRFLGQYDTRPIDSNRYVRQDEVRQTDEDRFLSDYDVRTNTVGVESDGSTSLILAGNIATEQPILLYLSIALILIGVFIFFWKVLT